MGSVEFSLKRLPKKNKAYVVKNGVLYGLAEADITLLNGKFIVNTRHWNNRVNPIEKEYMQKLFEERERKTYYYYVEKSDEEKTKYKHYSWYWKKSDRETLKKMLKSVK